ncbi:hypothetical protein ACIQNG_31520 [Streptomyces sp. NPDC091377]
MAAALTLLAKERGGMLNALRKTHVAEAAIQQAVTTLRAAFGTDGAA